MMDGERGILHSDDMKSVSIAVLVVMAGLASAASAAYSRGAHRAVNFDSDPQPKPVPATCTVLAAWTANGTPVDPSLARLTGAANRKVIQVGQPCGTNATTCAPALDISTGAPLEAWVSGC